MQTSTRKHRKEQEAERNSVSTRTINQWMADGIIPFYRVGRVVLFDPDEVDEALARKFRVAASGERSPRGRPMTRIATVNAATSPQT